mgnify:CR=1 FL=1
MERKSAWEKYDARTMKKVMTYADGYMDFLSNCKTERECVDYIITEIEKEGYKELVPGKVKKGSLKKGDKVYIYCGTSCGNLLIYSLKDEKLLKNKSEEKR